MSEKFTGALTKTGVSLISQAIESNTKLQFLNIIGSSTSYSEGQLSALTDEDLSKISNNQTGHISNIEIRGEDTVFFEAVLDGNTITSDYGLNSVFILANINGEHHLFAALKANQTQYMNAYDGKSSTNLQINVGFKIANTNVVDLTIDSAAVMTHDDYERLEDELREGDENIKKSLNIVHGPTEEGLELGKGFTNISPSSGKKTDEFKYMYIDNLCEDGKILRKVLLDLQVWYSGTGYKNGLQVIILPKSLMPIMTQDRLISNGFRGYTSVSIGKNTQEGFDGGAITIYYTNVSATEKNTFLSVKLEYTTIVESNQ